MKSKRISKPRERVKVMGKIIDRKWWLISVHGYGSFAYYGNAPEAELMRAHKAAWEGGVGTMETIHPDHPQAIDELKRLEKQHESGVVLDTNELSAIGLAP